MWVEDKDLPLQNKHETTMRERSQGSKREGKKRFNVLHDTEKFRRKKNLSVVM